MVAQNVYGRCLACCTCAAVTGGKEIDPVLLADKATWCMPPLQELARPGWSMTRKVGMYTLRGYLLLAVILLIAKVVALAISGQGTGAG